MTAQAPYYLRQSFLGNIPSLPISAADYEGIAAARAILSAALFIEEKYDLVLGNFTDLEREALLITMDQMTDHSFDYSKAYKILAVLNRRIANFIITGKNYTELIPSMAAKAFAGEAPIEADVNALKSRLYDSSFEYRFAEALRNHISHSSDAVHKVGTPSKWSVKDGKKGDTLTFNLDVVSLKERLRENSGFKKSVLNELGDQVDLKRVSRKYMGCISELQTEVRKLIADSVEASRQLIQRFTKQYADINDGDAFGLSAYSVVAIAEGAKPISMTLEWDDIRVQLAEKNDSISNMDKRCISSALTEPK